MKKIHAIVQARMNSSRLRGKVLKKFKGKHSILILLKRLSTCREIEKIIVAIPKLKNNKKLKKILIKNNYNVFEGSHDDVLRRYYDCAKAYNAQHILRITGDCPLIDPTLVDKVCNIYKKKNFDYVSNIEKRTFPDGMDTEVFSFKKLYEADKKLTLKNDREHVTKYFLRSDKIKKHNVTQKKNFSNIRITLDTKYDYEIIKKIFNNFNNLYFSLEDIIKFYKRNISLFNKYKKLSEKINSQNLQKGQKVWQLAKRFIAGGNMLFSKRPDAFLPNKWPSYFKKTKGCKIEGVDGKDYIDLSIMGIGTNLLGYSNTSVDKAVTNVVRQGNMSTLNCKEEVDLAKRLIELHPWAGKVRFARSGGEANAISIRLARAYTGRSKVAFCGYHGWHDWYLAANLKDKSNLNEHLLSGLKTGGVNKGLKGTAIPFRYNDFSGLKKIVKENPDLGVIKMEVIRNEPPKNNFLKKVRKLADEKNLVLIFDECTSGFRQTLGGIHKLYNVNPDIMMLGKAMGNGYAITAVVGKHNIMDSIKDTFVSSTFWTERIGPAAALKTIEIMEKKKSWIYVTNLGNYIVREWRKIAKRHNVKIKIKGIPALSSFVFLSKNHLAYRTLITQEMLKKNILATTSIYVSMSHNKRILKKYFDNLNHLFKIIKECESGKDDIYRYLESDVCETDFARLN